MHPHPGLFAPKFYIGAKTCPNNLPRFFPLVVEAAYRLGYNSAVPKENTKTRAGSGKPGCLEDKYYEKDHTSFVSHCLRCCCCRCCLDRLRRFCFLCCSFFYRCRLCCIFHRCCPVRNVAAGGSTSMKNVIAALTEALPRLSRVSLSATTPPVPAQASPVLPIRPWTSACPLVP